MTRISPIVRVAAAFMAACLAVLAPAHAQPRLPPEGFADLAETLTPAVVNIATSQRVEGIEDLPRFPPGSPLERFDRQFRDGDAQITSLGSGFIIEASGVIVTNNHVIDAADTIDVILQDGEVLRAAVVGRDPATDVAVLRVRASRPLPHVSLGDSDSARVGDLVLAVGNPFGLGGTVTIGIISARNRDIDAGPYDDFIQTDAAINRGNSGGPLFNMKGEVIGVNTAIVSQTGASVGVGFATPSAMVRPVVAQLLAYGETRRGWLGVRLADVDDVLARRFDLPRARGALITRVTPGGPAARAGLRPGDIVLRFAEHDIASARALTRHIGASQIGARVSLDVFREGARLTLEAAIERLEGAPARTRVGAIVGPDERVAREGGPRGLRLMGLSLSELDASLRAEYQIEPEQRGLLVLSVEPGGEAARKFAVGDLIEAAAFEPVDTVDAARAIAERAARARRPIVLRVERDGRTTYRSMRFAP